VERYSLPFPVGRATKGIETPYGVDSTPTSVFIDRQGIVVEQHVGGLSKEQFERRIEKLLADSTT
jgi:thioredoxin-related protein